VFNHSGKDWFAFRDVMERGKASPYRDWFYDLRGFPVDPAVPNYETFANNVRTMPKLDTSHPGLPRLLLDVAAHWVAQAGVDGWRLDVANEVDHAFGARFASGFGPSGPTPCCWAKCGTRQAPGSMPATSSTA
jgi:glycosidase